MVPHDLFGYQHTSKYPFQQKKMHTRLEQRGGGGGWWHHFCMKYAFGRQVSADTGYRHANATTERYKEIKWKVKHEVNQFQNTTYVDTH